MDGWIDGWIDAKVGGDQKTQKKSTWTWEEHALRHSAAQNEFNHSVWIQFAL